MPLFDAIIVADLAHVFAGPSTSFSNIDINGWSGPKIFSSLLVAVFLLSLLLSFWFKSFAIFWTRELWGFWVLSFFKELILKVLNRKSLKLGQGSKTVALRAALIYIPGKRRGQKADLCPSFNRFFTNSSQGSFSCLLCSIWAVIEGLSLSQKIQIKVDFLGAPLAFNSIKINCKCLKWEAKSCTFCCWYW